MRFRFSHQSLKVNNIDLIFWSLMSQSFYSQFYRISDTNLIICLYLLFINIYNSYLYCIYSEVWPHYLTIDSIVINRSLKIRLILTCLLAEMRRKFSSTYGWNLSLALICGQLMIYYHFKRRVVSIWRFFSNNCMVRTLGRNDEISETFRQND